MRWFRRQGKRFAGRVDDARIYVASFLADLLEDLGAALPAVVLALMLTAYLITSAVQARRAGLMSNQDRDTVTDSTFHRGCIDIPGYLAAEDYYRQNATIVMLARNSELSDVIDSLNSIQEHFNQWYNYPFTFLNNEEFTQEFKKAVRIAVAPAEASFGTLAPGQWELPHGNYSEAEAREALDSQGDRGILYGSNAAYHKMCRFFSGAFYKHPLVQRHQWYWRLEPGVQFYCDLTYDPFFEMQLKGKKYGFTIIISELYETVPRLFRTTLKFVQQQNVTVGSLWRVFTYDYNMVSESGDLDRFMNHPHEILNEVTTNITVQTLLERGLAGFPRGLKSLLKRSRRKVALQDDKFGNQEYNLCHFWSNFEIARVDLFDNDLYQRYFDYLDKAGGFWLERWGDAPVHSLGLGLLLNLSDVHYFRDIGYRHSSLHHCPNNAVQKPDIFTEYFANDARWDRTNPKYDKGQEAGTGCRCSCPKKHGVEDRASYCQHMWHENVRSQDPREPRRALYRFSDIYAQAKEKFNLENSKYFKPKDDIVDEEAQ